MVSKSRFGSMNLRRRLQRWFRPDWAFRGGSSQASHNGAQVTFWEGFLEVALITIAVILFCQGILGTGTAERLPGNEADTFLTLDWTLVNALKGSGRFPLWNPYIDTGLPFVGDPMFHSFNPFVSLPVLIFGVWKGFTLGLVFSFLLAAIGMWRLGLALGVGRAARIWMALMFAFAGQPAARFFQGQYLFVIGFAWIPWTITGLILAVETRKTRYAALAVASMGLLFFSGNVYYSFFMLLAALIFSLVAVLRRRAAAPFIAFDLARIRLIGMIGVIALLLVTVQLFPLLEFWPRMNKGVDVIGSHTPDQILLDFTSKDSLRPDAYQDLPAKEEFYAYIGWIPLSSLLFLPLAFRGKQRRWLIFFLLVLSMAVLWIGLKDMPWRDFFLQTRLLYQFRHLLRILIFASFAIICLAGLALHALWSFLIDRTRKPDPGDRVNWTRLSAQVGLYTLAVIMFLGVFDVFETNQGILHTEARDPIPYRVMNWLQAYDDSVYYVRRNPNNSWQDAFLSSQTRFMDIWYHFTEIWVFEMDTALRDVEARPNYLIQPQAMPVPEDEASSVVATLEHEVIYTLPDSLPFAFRVADRELELIDADPLTRSEVAAVPIFVPSPNKTEVIVTGEKDQTLVLMMTYFPGWKVSIDDRNHAIKNVGGYLAADILPGVHKYTFTYQPTWFIVGLALSLFASMFVVVWVALDVQRPKISLVEETRRIRAGLHALGSNLRSRLPQREAGLQAAEREADWQAGGLLVDEELPYPDGTRVHLMVEPLETGASRLETATRRWLRSSRNLLVVLIGKVAVEKALFLGGLAVYLLTRLIQLEAFPIYFFTDEAVQTLLASDFVRAGLRDPAGHLLPTYFQNASLFNLSISVYLQVIPHLLFGINVVTTRAASVLVTWVGALGIGLILRDYYRARYWWIGVLFLSITPAWFLHSRTAFETVLMVSFYVWFLYFYLRYRSGSPKSLYWVIVAGTLVFYSYSPGQIIIVASGLFLLFSDLRYHWQNRRIGLRAIGLIVLAVIPYIRFQALHGGETYFHLRMLNSYWLHDIPVVEKLRQFAGYYTQALSPAYWYFPNQLDLVRHVMKGYGSIVWPTLPLALTGLYVAVRKIRESRYRTLLFVLLAAPFGTAIVGIGLTRVLVFVVPAALLTALGFEVLAAWLAKRIAPQAIAMTSFALLAGFNFWMLSDSLRNGPTWFTDYGLYGMQFGARQVFGEIGHSLEQDPEREVYLSPVWANGADILKRYFFPDENRLSLLNLEGLTTEKVDDLGDKLFVLTPEEHATLVEDPKFATIEVVKTIPYPDGREGFYFLQLEYVDSVDEILLQEKIERDKPVTSSLLIENELVLIEHPPLDAGRIEDVFDGDIFTLARSREANPTWLTLTFSSPRQISGMTVSTGSMRLHVQVNLYTGELSDPIHYEWEFPQMPTDPTVELEFDSGPDRVTKMEIGIQNLNEGERAKIHIREITLH